MFTGEIPWWEALFFLGLGMVLNVVIHRILDAIDARKKAKS